MLDGTEDEEKFLASGIAGLQQNSFYMHRALDSNNLKDALKYSAQMLSELRTSKLSPHKYYELYMRAFDQLRKLEMFFEEETRRGCSIIDLYELVQHAGNTLPRLYLLCTIGSVYIKSKEAPAKDVLKDLVEMCRGIQNPVRGLFLRSYLSQVSRDKLPDIGSEYEGDADTVVDAVEFVLQNFTEMNKLWVRMQHQGPARGMEKREKERNELRDLVGKNLHVLSQIEGVDLDMYKDVVLPRVLEQVVNCKDMLAQFYLMDCIIQVFPDEYHLQTLDVLLGAYPQLQPSVDIKTVLSQLMDRLSNYAASSAEVLPEFLQVEAFSKLSNAIGKVIEAQPDMPTFGVVTLYSSLLKFTLHVHPDRLDYADQVLGACVEKLSGKGKIADNKATKQIVALLSAPLEKYNDVMTALKLSNYPRVLEYLDVPTNKVMATVIIQSIMKNGTQISTSDEVEALFELVKGLIKDSDGILNDEADEDDFKEEQNSVARLIQMLYNDDPEEFLKIIDTVRKHILTGGPKRLPFTVPPLVFSSLKLVRQLQGGQNENPFGDDVLITPKKIFQLLNQTIETLAGVQAPELALQLYLQCAEAANDSDLEPVAYEFFTQAYILYEEEISDSRAQITALHLIIGTLQRMHIFSVENRDTLTHKATGYSAKLLKKPDQCRAVYACSHLFWIDDRDNMKNGERVLLCLKRALRIANAAQQMSNAARGSTGSVVLFIEILNKYLYFFEKGTPEVTVASIQSLIELIMNEMQSECATADPAADAFLASTMRYIHFQKQKGGTVGEKYESIKV
ncbi:PREDICTED: vacuolar protein sorting-associated protein 35A-like [Lupinus angustifolius]|uniref:vacuolar protein sorting-associated protein 35A-like n=1 Tax=Lupinus angustifolius TaxID=3871 RepID=UPI00092F75FF|nr:PREDICTED: vacuolar protein sorting-associated protein 35A-like [Lupinus angustifolius]